MLRCALTSLGGSPLLRAPTAPALATHAARVSAYAARPGLQRVDVQPFGTIFIKQVRLHSAGVMCISGSIDPTARSQ